MVYSWCLFTEIPSLRLFIQVDRRKPKASIEKGAIRFLKIETSLSELPLQVRFSDSKVDGFSEQEQGRFRIGPRSVGESRESVGVTEASTKWLDAEVLLEATLKVTSKLQTLRVHLTADSSIGQPEYIPSWSC